MSHYQPIEAADINWINDNPHSHRHGDIYFSSDGGLRETEHVFLHGNQLPERWQNRQTFTIAETGFGSGLNFLCTLKHWFTTTSADSRLHYLSVEKYPLTHADLQRAVSYWLELTDLSAELLAHYPPLVHGMHQRRLFGGRVNLTLLFGDAATMYAELDTGVDAWYLDGFAPGKNPDMWTPELFQQIARLTRPGGSLATFSAAGVVRRGLQQAGFEIHTQPGFGRKRDMTVGQLTSPTQTNSQQPWFEYPDVTTTQKRAVVIGGGLAGCSISHALAQRGWQIDLIERHNHIAQEASGNLAGVVMPRLTADMGVDGRFYLSAFLQTTHWLNQLKQRDPDLPWFQNGVLQLCDTRQQQRISTLGLPKEIIRVCDADMAKQFCGMTTSGGGLFYPGGGWLEPPALCQWLLKDQRKQITMHLNQTALQLQRNDNHWHVRGTDSVIASAEVMIIANAYEAEQLLGTNVFGLQKVRGQLTYLHASNHSQRLKTPVCYHGYITPAHRGRHCVGASYDNRNMDLSLNHQDEQQILDELGKALPNFKTFDTETGRAAIRTSTLDHLPLIGPVPDVEFYRRHYADLRHGKAAHHYPNAKYLPNLFISAGHGSRGLVSCHYAAEAIATQLDQGVVNMKKDLVHATHPARYLIRQLKKSK